MVKDLAGLLASWPGPALSGWGMRFLIAYAAGDRARARVLAPIVARKAQRIRRHRPKYG
jgi:hypothetical protein